MALRRSPSLAILLLLFHLLVAGVVFQTSLSVAPKVVIFFSITLSLVYHLARDALLLMRHSWREVVLSADGVSIVLRDGACFSGRVAGETVVSPYFVVLGVCPEGGRLSVFRVIFPDALGRDRFRELCVRLRFV